MQIRLYLYSLTVFVLSFFAPRAMANPHGTLESTKQLGGNTCIITTYSLEYRWSSRVIAHIKQNLMTKYSGSVSTINIPIVSINSNAELKERLDDLKHMLRSVRPKRLILVGSSCFSLCETLDSWFPDISMLLIGGEDYAGKIDMLTSGKGLLNGNTVPVSQLRKKYNISLQCMPVYIKEEIALIHKLLPHLENLYYVGGDDQFSTVKEEEIRSYVAKEHGNIRFVPLLSQRMSLDSLVLVLSKLDPKKDAVIFSSWVNRILYKESPILMSRSLFFLNVSTAPIFTMRENGWMEDSQDILGGCFLDEKDFYGHLDRALTMFAGGMPARQIPQYKAGKPIVKLNYACLETYGINPDDCPADTQFTNKPLNLWESYHNEITIVGMLLLLTLIVLLAKAYKDSVRMRHLQRSKIVAMEKELERKRQNTEFLENVPALYMRCLIEQNEEEDVVSVRIIAANKNLRELWEKRSVRVVGKTITEVMPLAASSLIYKIMQARRIGKRVLRAMLYIPDTGEHLDTLVYFYGQDKIAVLMRDNTEIFNATRNLKEAKERVERSEKIKREFINNITHEVRTPLNAICGLTELLTNKETMAMLDDKEREKMKVEISSNTRNLVEILNNILEYSDIVNGSSKKELTSCSIVGTARMAMQQAYNWQNDGVEMKLETTLTDKCMIRMCQSRVLIVLECMLSNACKFTKQGSVVLSVEKDEEKGIFRYVCTDTGCGVPEDKADYIFEGFTQIDIFAQGTGLGLAISRLIADEMGGKIYLDTSYKDGARFVFELQG